MEKITISKNKKLSFDVKSVANAVYSVLNQTGKISVEINAVDKEYIKTLNRETRGIDRVTDVLSYPTLDGIRYKTVLAKDFPLDSNRGRVFLGSILICEEVAMEQAKSFGHSLERELSYLCAHGLLHLFGYDHMIESDDIEMRALADRAMEILNLTR